LGDDRTWAIESAGGLGKLLAQQLIGAGEHVIDVPPTLSARVQLLGSTRGSKNDRNDALATAIAGLRHCGLRRVAEHRHLNRHLRSTAMPIIMWLLGVPLSLIIALWLFGVF
jgi:transposase